MDTCKVQWRCKPCFLNGNIFRSNSDQRPSWFLPRYLCRRCNLSRCTIWLFRRQWLQHLVRSLHNRKNQQNNQRMEIHNQIRISWRHRIPPKKWKFSMTQQILLFIHKISEKRLRNELRFWDCRVRLLVLCPMVRKVGGRRMLRGTSFRLRVRRG